MTYFTRDEVEAFDQFCDDIIWNGAELPEEADFPPVGGNMAIVRMQIPPRNVTVWWAKSPYGQIIKRHSMGLQ